MGAVCRAGGSDQHSGYSFSCVKSVAAVVLRHGSIDDISREYGVSHSLTSMINTGKHRANVEV